MTDDDSRPSSKRFLGFLPKDASDEELYALIKDRVEAANKEAAEGPPGAGDVEDEASDGEGDVDG